MKDRKSANLLHGSHAGCNRSRAMLKSKAQRSNLQRKSAITDERLLMNDLRIRWNCWIQKAPHADNFYS